MNAEPQDGSEQRFGPRAALALLLAIGIFLVDTFAPLEVSAAVLYVLVLVLADEGRSRTPIVFLGWGCAALATTSFVIDHVAHLEAGALLRLSISLAAIGMTAGLLLRNRTALAALRAHDQRYRTIFDTVAVAFWEHDFSAVDREVQRLRRDGVEDLRAYFMARPGEVRRLRGTVTVRNANETALRLLKVPSSDHFFSHLSDFLPDEDESFIHGILAVAERTAGFETETRFRAYDGSLVDVFVNLSFPADGMEWDRVCGSIMDVTERRRTQGMLERTRAELDHAMRAAAVGELTASITHEVSQPLFAIRAQADAARRWLSRTPAAIEEARLALDQVHAAAIEAADVIHKVRRMTSPSAPRREEVDVLVVVDECVQLARRQFAATTIDVRDNSRSARLLGDDTALRHLLMNLLKNAFEAMKQDGSGERWIGVSLERSADKVLISVADAGPGFPAEVLVHPFEPVIPISEGRLGIGLPMSRSIVRAHDGRIELRNRPSGGGEVLIWLPCS